LSRAAVDDIRRAGRGDRAEEAIKRLERASTLFERGDAKGAAAEAARAKASAPRSAAVREGLGLALYSLERWQEALSEMQAYRRLSGRADQNHIIADCQRALGRPERAVELAEEALGARDVPAAAKAEAAIVAAAALRDQGRHSQALALLRRVPTREDVGRAYVLRIWYLEADVLDRAGRRDEAARLFRRILRHDTGAFDVAERLAQLS
jgi:tetratricopeptide (TPR) repeat protein